MAIDDIGGGTGDDVQPVPLGVRVTLANTPDKIRALLPNGGRGSLLQKPSEYSSFQLRTNRTTKILKRKSAKEMTSYTRADGDTVMVFFLANTNGNTGGSGGGFNYEKIFNELTGAVKQFAIDLHTKNAAMAASWFADKGVLKYSDTNSGKILTPDEVSERYNQGTSKFVSINGADEQAGARAVQESAAAAVAISAVMAATSKGKSLFKDPDTLKTIKKGYTGMFKGKPIKMDDVPIKKFEFKKRNRKDYGALQKKAPKAKSNFNNSLADNPDKIADLKKKGFSNSDIANLKEGRPPNGYEVHHKLPPDDGGTNDPKNLILTKKIPFHSTFTTEQRKLTGKLKPGESKIIEFPVPKGNIYPPKV